MSACRLSVCLSVVCMSALSCSILLSQTLTLSEKRHRHLLSFKLPTTASPGSAVDPPPAWLENHQRRGRTCKAAKVNYALKGEHQQLPIKRTSITLDTLAGVLLAAPISDISIGKSRVMPELCDRAQSLRNPRRWPCP